MKVSVMISVIPIGTGTSLSAYIAACEKILAEAGLRAELHAHGTNVEGEWDQVFGAIRRCIETVHAMGAPRVSTHLKLGTRTDRDVSMEQMVRSVKEKLDRP
jgi:uncharacterized protein (TIGR00106 family)